uniref:Methyltransferase NSUN7 n=1 Tax=Cacopsylla melanoneura TaxID=428564 RepID=A0A8D8X8E9_9HEMI
MLPHLEYLQTILPSDKQWRQRNYSILLEKKKAILRSRSECPGAPITPVITRPKTRKLDTLVSYSTSLDDISSVSKESSAVPSGDVTWSPLDLCKAARVFIRDTCVTFETREDMKRVYALLGDVLRYKSVLQKALEEVDFYGANPQFTDMRHLVWLFTYDMYKLNFKPRIERNSPQVDSWYADHGFDLLIRQVWLNRIQIAAAVARIRIRNTALRLKTLLPSHLQEYKFLERCTEKVALNGWVNFAKTTIAEVESLLTEMGYYPRGQLKPSEFDVPLDCFMGDHVLPGFIHVLPSDVKEFLTSRLIVNNMLVLQDRSYCFAPALLCKFMLDEKLTGSVIMSHFDIPSTVGYMASLLTNVNHEPEDKLRVYGVGTRREEHLLTYTTSMGFTNVELYSEEFTTVRPGAKCLENVVAVLATPPNTNTAVKDLIELVVAKGGDLDLLLNLLSDDFENEVVGKYIQGHMEVQKKTLRLAMSRPQIQVIVYETHSKVSLENDDMIDFVVTEMNNYATEKYLLSTATSKQVNIEETPRTADDRMDSSPRQPTDSTPRAVDTPLTVQTPLPLDNPLPIDTPDTPLPETPQPPDIVVDGKTKDTNEIVTIADIQFTPTEPLSERDRSSREIKIPSSDHFQLIECPQLCNRHKKNCLLIDEEGAYIAVVARREITRMDEEYMIKMAEEKGIFGDKNPPPPVETAVDMKKKMDMKRKPSTGSGRVDDESEVNSDTDRHKFDEDNMARIMAPTVASLRHEVHVSHPALIPCPRDHYHSAGIPVLGGYRLQPRPSNEPRRWWHSVINSVVEKIRRPAGRMRPLRLFRSRRIRRLSPIPVAVRTIEYSEAGTWDSLSYVGKSRTI